MLPCAPVEKTGAPSLIACFRARSAQNPQRKDKGGDGSKTSEAAHAGISNNGALLGGVYRDLDIIEPDDDPLSCLADEEDSAGGNKSKMRFLVAPVDPELAVSYSW